MKCEKCGNNEAVFHYKSTVNGKSEERHLCAECAQQQGYGELLSMDTGSVFDWGGSSFDSFFDRPFGMLDGFFGGDVFSGGFGSLAQRMLTPTRAFPQIRIVVGDETPESGECDTCQGERQSSAIPADAGEEIRKKREINVLKNQLDEALKAENYEKCIELRDKIRKMES